MCRQPLNCADPVCQACPGVRRVRTVKLARGRERAHQRVQPRGGHQQRLRLWLPARPAAAIASWQWTLTTAAAAAAARHHKR